MPTPNSTPRYAYLLVESDSARGQRLKAGHLRHYSVIDSWNHGSLEALLTWMEAGFPLYLGDTLVVRWECTGERDMYDAEVLRSPAIVAQLWPGEPRVVRSLQATLTGARRAGWRPARASASAPCVARGRLPGMAPAHTERYTK